MQKVFVTVGDSARHCRAMAPCRPPCCRAAGPPLPAASGHGGRPLLPSSSLSPRSQTPNPNPSAPASPPPAPVAATTVAPADASDRRSPRRRLPPLRLELPSPLTDGSVPGSLQSRESDPTYPASGHRGRAPPPRRRPSPCLAVLAITIGVSSWSGWTPPLSLSPSLGRRHRAPPSAAAATWSPELAPVTIWSLPPLPRLASVPSS